MALLTLFSRKKKPAPAKKQPQKPPPPQEVHRAPSYSSVSLPDLVSLKLDIHTPVTADASPRTIETPARAARVAPRPPRINTGQPVALAPASPISRRLESRQLPASYVRHLRVFSTPAASWMDGGAGNTSLRRRLRTLLPNLPPELLPVVHLLNAQRLRQYAAGPVWVASGDDWVTCDALLTGTELCLLEDGASTAHYINVQDCTVVWGRESSPGVYDMMVLQDYDANMATLRFEDAPSMAMWLAAVQLSKFENTSLNEAFTAVVLLLKGPTLLDIYTLLAHKKRFPRFEWCNLRLPQVLSKWVRVYMVIIPGDSKKKGRIEVYALDKASKKSLVLYVNDATAVYNVYPEDPAMILFNLIMKLEGEVFVNKQYEPLFAHDAKKPSAPTPMRLLTRPSLTSLDSFNQPPTIGSPGHIGRLRSTSVNSATSFFVNAPLPAPEGLARPSSPRAPSRKVSQNFFKKQSANNFVLTSYLYLMPLTHPGVSASEIMIRNFVHIVDAFKLYGRPDHLNSDKNNRISMLFGMPLLPRCFYLSTDEVYNVVAANFDTARLDNWSELDWRACLKEYLACKQADGGYKGTGNIGELLDSVELECESLSLPQYGLRVTSPVPLMPSRLRQSTSDMAIHHLPVSYSESSLQLNDPYVGKYGFDERVRMELLSLRQFGADTVRALEPIVDLPTPMDEHSKKQYFVVDEPRRSALA